MDYCKLLSVLGDDHVLKTVVACNNIELIALALDSLDCETIREDLGECLIVAIKLDNCDIVTMLLNKIKKISINDFNDEIASELWTRIVSLYQKKKYTMLECILDNVDDHTIEHIICIASQYENSDDNIWKQWLDKYINTISHNMISFACRNGHVQFIEHIKDRVDFIYEYIFLDAVQSQNIDLVKLIIETNANIADYYVQAFNFALEQKSIELLHLLFSITKYNTLLNYYEQVSYTCIISDMETLQSVFEDSSKNYNDNIKILKLICCNDYLEPFKFIISNSTTVYDINELIHSVKVGEMLQILTFIVDIDYQHDNGTINADFLLLIGLYHRDVDKIITAINMGTSTCMRSCILEFALEPSSDSERQTYSKIIDILLDTEIDIHKDNDSIISTAIRELNYRVLNWCVSIGCDFESKLIDIDCKKSPEDILQMVKFLIDHGANINYIHEDLQPSTFIESLLYSMPIISENNKPDEIKYLNIIKYAIDSGVDISVNDYIIACYAVINNSQDIVEYLLQFVPDFHREIEIVNTAICYNRLSMVQYLVNKYDRIDLSYLTYAVCLRNFKIFNFLLSRVKDTNMDFDNVLHHAIFASCNDYFVEKMLKYKVIEQLLDCGAYIELPYKEFEVLPSEIKKILTR